MDTTPAEPADPSVRRRTFVALALTVVALGLVLVWRRWRMADGNGLGGVFLGRVTSGDALTQGRAGVDPRVSVTCQVVRRVGPPTLFCRLDPSPGTAAHNVCWDAVVRCRNGQTATAHQCQTVQPQVRATAVLTGGRITNQDRCDRPISVDVEHLTVSGS